MSTDKGISKEINRWKVIIRFWSHLESLGVTWDNTIRTRLSDRAEESEGDTRGELKMAGAESSCERIDTIAESAEQTREREVKVSLLEVSA